MADCVMGIDPGLTVLATAYADGPDLGSIVVETIRPRTVGAARLVYLRDGFEARLDAALPSLCVLEGYSYGSTNQAHQLGEVGGLIRAACYDANVPLIVVPPGKLKLWLTGYGNASKDRMMLAAQSKLGHHLTITRDDEADALAGFWLGAKVYGWDVPIPDDDVRAEILAYALWAQAEATKEVEL